MLILACQPLFTISLVLRLTFIPLFSQNLTCVGNCFQLKILKYNTVSCIEIIVCVWQVLNIGDHWITVTNKFSADPNVVYMYDSLHGRVLATNTVVQLTSLQRQHVESDRICVVWPIYALQRHLSRLCGYFTLAAAYAVCSGEDPTRRKDNSSAMVSFIDTNLLTDSVHVVPHLPDVHVANRRRQTTLPLPSATIITLETMIECSLCEWGTVWYSRV